MEWRMENRSAPMFEFIRSENAAPVAMN